MIMPRGMRTTALGTPVLMCSVWLWRPDAEALTIERPYRIGRPCKPFTLIICKSRRWTAIS